MFPSEDRRWRHVMIATLPVALAIGAIADAGDWSVGWIWLSIGAFMALAMTYVHRERPGERQERERFARERRLSCPPEARRWLRR